MEKLTPLPFKEYFIGSLILNLVIAVLVLVLRGMLPPVVPLFYGLPTGEEQLVSNYFLTIPSLIALFLTTINAFITKFFKDTFTHKVLIGLTVAITLLASITTIKIFFLVASF